jgi:DNA replicative helicase MCM subunit Mcm2 (Cdc46/Mcm family)
MKRHPDLSSSPLRDSVFTELATRPNIFARLVSSIAPSIHGHNDIKTALLLSMYSFLNSVSPLS